MAQYYHAHQVDLEKCRGHMACMRHCPTRAIRVRDGKARISEELCVDCGSCISACPEGAIAPISDPVGDISLYKYKVVVPSQVLYTQFAPNIHPFIIHLALKKIGFDEVVDVITSSTALAMAILKFTKKHRGRFPLISSDCPSALRLIQVRYPDLVELIVPLDVPREITAREVRKTFPARLGLRPQDIGIFYVAPCPAKIVSIKQPAEKAVSWFDGVVSVKDVYSVLVPHVMTIKESFDERQVPDTFVFEAGWVEVGSMTRAVKMENWLAVSGLDHVMKIFDDIETSRLRTVDFVEAATCMLGCIGAPFCMENPYVARANSIKQELKYGQRIKVSATEVGRKLAAGYFAMEKPVLPRPTKYFDTDLETSIKRMRESERVYHKLPQIDCGCCGAPTCMTFAEDFVRSEAQYADCIVLAEKKVTT